jgi:signal transduction histidine kinase
VLLSVSNKGSIAAELLPHLFDPFRGTRERHSGRYGGLGLGLYIVQQIVIAHGGRIDVFSGTNDTTTFTVEFPHTQAAAQGHGETSHRAEA